MYDQFIVCNNGNGSVINTAKIHFYVGTSVRFEKNTDRKELLFLTNLFLILLFWLF